MNRIGDEIFAVEFELHPLTGNPQVDEYLDGRIQFVVGGFPVGNGSWSWSLNAATVDIAELLQNRGRRANRELMIKDAETIFRTAYEALYVDSGQSDEQVEHDAMVYGPLSGVPRGSEGFDNWFAVLVEDSNQARYVWKRFEPESPVREQKLRPGQFDDVLEAFMNEMRRLAPCVVR